MALVSGSWYEPASLWSAQYVSVPNSTSPNTNVTFNRQHFRNGGRHPIVLQRLAACGINYPFDKTGAAVFVLPSAYAAGADAAIMQGTVRIGMPFRKNFSRYTIPLSQYTPKPTNMPRPPGASQSSLWGTSYLRFPRPILLPQRSSIEGGLMSLKRAQAGFTNAGSQTTSDAPMPAYMYFHESGGLFSGSARIKALQVRTDSSDVVPVPDPYGCIPYPLPAPYTVPATYPTAPHERMWPPPSQMSSRDFEQQESTRSGSTEVLGCGVFIDQLTYDDELIAQAGGNDPGMKVSQISTRLGVRMRAKHSPDGTWWWRPGAPLALVFDTITPAVVYELPEPITLAPGDAINVTMQLPGGVTPHGVGFNVGLSFNGYMAIEG